MDLNFKRLFKQFITNPNSSSGLIMRAEMMEENAEKEDGDEYDKSILYARVLRELANKGLSVEDNKKFIKENLRKGM